MKDKLSIIKINGFTGIFIAVFLIGCLIEGAIMFPSKLLMHGWNFIAGYVENMPVMNLLHGTILWAIIALSAFAILKDRKPISYHTPTATMTEEEFKKMLENSKAIENIENLTPIIKEENSEQEIKH